MLNVTILLIIYNNYIYVALFTSSITLFRLTKFVHVIATINLTYIRLIGLTEVLPSCFGCVAIAFCCSLFDCCSPFNQLLLNFLNIPHCLNWRFQVVKYSCSRLCSTLHHRIRAVTTSMCPFRVAKLQQFTFIAVAWGQALSSLTGAKNLLKRFIPFVLHPPNLRTFCGCTGALYSPPFWCLLLIVVSHAASLFFSFFLANSAAAISIHLSI